MIRKETYSMMENTLDMSPQIEPRQIVKIVGPTCGHIQASSPKRRFFIKP